MRYVPNLQTYMKGSLSLLQNCISDRSAGSGVLRDLDGKSLKLPIDVKARYITK